MPKGDRDEPLQFGGLIVALVLGVLACAIVLLAYGRDHSEQRASAAAHYKHDRFLNCIALGVTSPAQCKAQADQSRYDQSAEAYDLQAQQDMAKWALLMLIVTGVGVALIAMTVWQTRGVLREAKKTTSAANRTVDETKRIGDAQVRAYLGIGGFELVNYIKGAKPKIRFTIKNFGQTPALDVVYESAAYWFNWGAPVKIYFDNPKNIVRIGPVQPGDTSPCSVEVSLPENAAHLPSMQDLGEFHVGIYIRYLDHTKRRRRLLLHAYLQPKNMNGAQVQQMEKYPKHNCCD
jgi:hypothetical protein